MYLRLRVDSRQEGEWEESELQEWERWNTEEGKGECNQERRAGWEHGTYGGISSSSNSCKGWGGVSARRCGLCIDERGVGGRR